MNADDTLEIEDILFVSHCKGARDESTNVNADQAKVDAKVQKYQKMFPFYIITDHPVLNSFIQNTFFIRISLGKKISLWHKNIVYFVLNLELGFLKTGLIYYKVLI